MREFVEIAAWGLVIWCVLIWMAYRMVSANREADPYARHRELRGRPEPPPTVPGMAYEAVEPSGLVAGDEPVPVRRSR